MSNLPTPGVQSRGWGHWAQRMVERGLIIGLAAAAGLFARRVAWLCSWWREPGLLAVATLVAWWTWPPLVLLVVGATGWYVWSPQGRRMQALEAERRDVMRVVRHWRLSRLWPIRFSHKETPWAITKSGHRVPRCIPGANVLVGGVPGSGKSVAIHGALACVADNPYIHLVCIDLKGGVELTRWKRRCDVWATNHTQALAALTAVETWLAARLADMESQQVALDDGTHDDGLEDVGEPSERWPHVVVVVDEAAALMRSPRHAKTFHRLLSDGVQRGRAAGLAFLCGTQAPKADILPTDFRDQFHVSAVGATRTRAMAEVIAGSGVFGKDAEVEWGEDAPWRLNVEKPGYRDSGRFILVRGGAEPVRFVHRSRTETAAQVRRTAHVAEHPIIVLAGTEPAVDVEEVELELEDRDEPSMDWSRDQLADEVQRLTGKRPELHPSGRPNRARLLEMIADAKGKVA